MIATAKPDLVTVNIDGKEIAVPKGTNVIEAARLVNVDVPHYCYHPKLTIVGNCRMCLIEMGMPAVDPATKAPIMDPATGKQKREWRWHPPDLLPPEPPPGTSTSGADDEGGTTMPQPEKALGTSGSSGSTQNGAVAKQRAASGGELSGLPSSTGTTGTTGTKREKQGVQERFQSGQVAQDAGTAGTKAYREARRAGYSHTEAASIAQAEGEGVPDV